MVQAAAGNLLGPADQDLLMDVLVTTLYSRPIALRTSYNAKVHFGRLRDPTAVPRLRHRDHHTRATPTDTLRRAHCPQKTGERQGSWSRETCSDKFLLATE